MSGEIHHGPHQGPHQHGHGDWHANPLPGGTPTGAPGEVHQGHHTGRAHQQQANLQRDVQSSAQLAETQSHDQAHNIASGFRYATLSQSQLDGADPTQPRLSDVRSRAATGSLPGGPSGTGNPFFKPNPMVTFFTAFMTLMQAMKWLQKVATKLTVIQMQGVKDTGLAQAAATLEAGKAQARADRAQGILSAIQGAFSFAQLGASIHTDLRASKQAGAAFKKEQRSANEMEDLANKQEKSVADMQARVNAKTKLLKGDHVEIEIKQGPYNHTKQLDAQGRHLEKKAAAKQARKQADDDFQTTQNAFLQKKGLAEKKEKATEMSELRKDIEKDKKAMQKNLEDGKSAREADEYFKEQERWGRDVRNDPAKKKQLEDEIANDQRELVRAKSEAASIRSQANQSWSKAEEYDFKGTNLKAWQTRAQIKQGDPVYQAFYMGGPAVNYVLEAIKHFFKATGEEQSAYYQSIGQIMGTYNQMIKTGLDSTINMNRDAYQQASELAGTLTKMSDQEAQSMHWAA